MTTTTTTTTSFELSDLQLATINYQLSLLHLTDHCDGGNKTSLSQRSQQHHYHGQSERKLQLASWGQIADANCANRTIRFATCGRRFASPLGVVLISHFASHLHGICLPVCLLAQKLALELGSLGHSRRASSLSRQANFLSRANLINARQASGCHLLLLLLLLLLRHRAPRTMGVHGSRATSGHQSRLGRTCKHTNRHPVAER